MSYFNNGNLLIAAWFAYTVRAAVALRIMGAYPNMKGVAARPRSLGERLEHLAYRAPFALAICSRDGSGGGWFMDRALSRKTPRISMINGLDWGAQGRPGPDEREASMGGGEKLPVILFLGKMEREKGCDEFLSALLALLEEREGNLEAVMIGTGPREEALRRKASRSRHAQRIRLISRVPHAHILQWHRSADVYVSLNKLGSLSNANLEAMAFGGVVVCLESDPGNQVDLETDVLFPSNAVVRIGREDIEGNLLKALRHLLDHPDERKARGLRTRDLARRLIPSWEERIEREVDLLQGLSGAG
ncbi:MAG: glycosyltransferase [Deltaproteobacteria bacterium]|nr:glycosyltransferase [Deltaproteobacteria bacterium]